MQRRYVSSLDKHLSIALPGAPIAVPLGIVQRQESKSLNMHLAKVPRSVRTKQDAVIIIALATLCAALSVLLVLGAVWFCRTRLRKHSPVLDAEPGNPWRGGNNDLTRIVPVLSDRPVTTPQHTISTQRSHEQKPHCRRNWNETDTYQLPYQRLTPPTPPPKDPQVSSYPIAMQHLPPIEEASSQQTSHIPFESTNSRPWNPRLDSVSEKPQEAFEAIGLKRLQSGLLSDNLKNIHPALRHTTSRRPTSVECSDE